MSRICLRNSAEDLKSQASSWWRWGWGAIQESYISETQGQSLCAPYLLSYLCPSFGLTCRPLPVSGACQAGGSNRIVLPQFSLFETCSPVLCVSGSFSSLESHLRYCPWVSYRNQPLPPLSAAHFVFFIVFLPAQNYLASLLKHLPQ